MTLSTDPWKLFRVALVVSALALMVVRIGCQPIYQDESGGCSMTMHQE